MMKKCDHRQNVRHRKYHSNDGTPMIETECFDCGYTDKGVVYADEWKDELIVISNGKVNESILDH
jgi:hypothetical protein